MRLFELFEAVGPDALYHGTGVDQACSIIEDDLIKDKTSHESTHLMAVNGFNRQIAHGFRKKDLDPEAPYTHKVKGVSLTRDIRLARKWKGFGVVFGFSRDRLKHNYRFLPYDYFRNRKESEEFLVGPLKNMSRYLISIDISQQVLDSITDRDRTFSRRPIYQELINHPLLRVVGPSWNPITGQIRRE